MRLRHLSRDGSSSQGFSLLEVMITIAILSIILFIGIPGFNSMFQAARERAATSSFVTAMNLARTEAITRGAFVRVCIGSSCTGSSDEIQVAVENGGSTELLRTWDTERDVEYRSNGTEGLGVRFSPMGLSVDSSGAQRKAGMSVSIVDTSGASESDVAGYCIGVTGGVSKGGCN
ncbi:GspH/FimT family pseudopilin [Marinobacterium marinum]|uniref:Type II secretion system protein H n=1 Tax=Marinobacterium marinum TaxID=2756129 RepID=A0A7W2ABP3_9GAMM|nr:GspH/FimT family pseudopilin [Marinobacterium marinum]MBA4501298.1 GspH/FimT family pseudopilin [Marinobacterium marinum]